jgi:hypothetical protein
MQHSRRRARSLTAAGGAPFAPEGIFLSSVAEASSSTALFFVLCFGLPIRTGIERNARPETVVHFSGEPEASTVSVLFFSFSLFSDFRVGVPVGGDCFTERSGP